jgi:hypothetical protein
MPIILKNGSVFLHVPKTGGTWVASVLKDLGLIEKRVSVKHATFLCGKRELYKMAVSKLSKSKEIQNPPFSFCFVRNPITWYESWFNYMNLPNIQWRTFGDENDIRYWHPSCILNKIDNTNFNSFVQSVNKKRPGYVTELYGWFTMHKINFIGKQEDLLNDFIKVLNIMNINFDEDFVRQYPRQNQSVPPENGLVWDKETLIKTAIYEYSAFVRYGYQEKLFELGLDPEKIKQKLII